MALILQINLKLYLYIGNVPLRKKLSGFTIHLSIHLLTVLLGYDEVLISVKEEHKILVDYDPSL